MMTWLRAGALCGAVLVCGPAAAQSLGPGHVLGNPTASTAPGTDASLTAMFDRAFCSTNNAIIARLGGTWGCTTQSALLGIVNVRDFGAVCGSVTDDYTSIVNADAAAAAAGKALYFPAGTCITGTRINITRNNAVWFGDGPKKSIIKSQRGGIDTAVWLGEVTATTQYVNALFRDLGFDAASGTNAALQLRNISGSSFENLWFSGAVAAGMKTDSSGATTNTLQSRNFYSNLEATTNFGDGFSFGGEKDSSYSNLFAHNNNGNGITFRSVLLGGTLAETTQSVCNNLLSRDNALYGFVIDEVEKFNCGTVSTMINGSGGLIFRTTITAAGSGTGSNSLRVANFISRNDIGPAISGPGAYVQDAYFGGVYIRGGGAPNGTTAIDIQGFSKFSIGSLDISGWPGTLVRIRSGTNLFGPAESNYITIQSATLVGNGSGAPANTHGISIEDASSNISIGSLAASNVHTASTNYELSVGASVSNVLIGSANLAASGGAGNNTNILNTTTFIAIGIPPAWNTYAPMITCSGGGSPSPSTGTGRFKQIGKTVFVYVSYTISMLNGCGGDVSLALPPGITPQNTNVPGSGLNIATNGGVVAKISTIPSLQFIGGASTQGHSGTFVFEAQ